MTRVFRLPGACAVAGHRRAAATVIRRDLRRGGARIGAGRGLHRDHVGHATRLQCEPEPGGIAVAGIGDHGALRQSPTAARLIAGDLIEHVQREAPFLPVPHLIGDLGARATSANLARRLDVRRAGIVPGLRQEQPPVDRRGRPVGHRMHADPDLAVPGLAQRPAVLPSHPGRINTVLGEAAVIDHIRLRRDEPVRPPRQPPPNLDVIPRRGRDELLQLLMIDPKPRRHRLHRLTLAIQHQPTQIQPALGTLISPSQPAQHLAGERLQAGPDLDHLLRSHTNTRSEHDPEQPQRHT